MAETRRTIAGTAVHDILRGILVVVAGAMMILPAYLNDELYKRANLDPTVSMSISLMFFALGIFIFILVVGKDRIEGRTK